jgi:hypothetical protein
VAARRMGRHGGLPLQTPNLKLLPKLALFVQPFFSRLPPHWLRFSEAVPASCIPQLLVRTALVLRVPPRQIGFVWRRRLVRSDAAPCVPAAGKHPIHTRSSPSDWLRLYNRPPPPVRSPILNLLFSLFLSHTSRLRLPPTDYRFHSVSLLSYEGVKSWSSRIPAKYANHAARPAAATKTYPLAKTQRAPRKKGELGTEGKGQQALRSLHCKAASSCFSDKKR